MSIKRHLKRVAVGVAPVIPVLSQVSMVHAIESTKSEGVNQSDSKETVVTSSFVDTSNLGNLAEAIETQLGETIKPETEELKTVLKKVEEQQEVVKVVEEETKKHLDEAEKKKTVAEELTSKEEKVKAEIEDLSNKISEKQAELERKAEEERLRLEEEARQNAYTNSYGGTTTVANVEAQSPATPGSLGGVSFVETTNTYPWGQCTWGVKNLLSWVGPYWGNASSWDESAAAEGYTIGTTPVPGAIAVWNGGYMGYGHVALVTDVQSNNSIKVLESNVNGAQYIGDHRGWFDPTATSEGYVTYIYPKG